MADIHAQWALEYETSARVCGGENAACEARAQAAGDRGPEGVEAYRAWLVKTDRLAARHIIAQASVYLGKGWTRTWSRWNDGVTDYSDRDEWFTKFPCIAEAPLGLRWVDTTTLRPLGEQ
jgi:hypothetical protein